MSQNLQRAPMAPEEPDGVPCAGRLPTITMKSANLRDEVLPGGNDGPDGIKTYLSNTNQPSSFREEIPPRKR
ncbi:hypothetical protein CEXT_754311 [Caerostris extrusa]|uniref:Transformer n=1 Tax=Caerostris extrusa TaxID=172846 RepID=A0AAV4XF37_CAEEX|nr:hypothetical protein CEXT_754311 [Caerostris extrusa]